MAKLFCKSTNTFYRQFLFSWRNSVDNFIIGFKTNRNRQFCFRFDWQHLSFEIKVTGRFWFLNSFVISINLFPTRIFFMRITRVWRYVGGLKRNSSTLVNVASVVPSLTERKWPEFCNHQLINFIHQQFRADSFSNSATIAKPRTLAVILSDTVCDFL